MPMMILPLLSTLVIGLLMFFVIGVPIVWATQWLTDFLTSMRGSMRFVFGALMGAMAAFDFGGPVNKVASLFADGLLLEGVTEPEAVKVLASMVPPFGVGISLLLARIVRKPIYTAQERNNIGIAIPMGVCMITEGVIPIAASRSPRPSYRSGRRRVMIMRSGGAAASAPPSSIRVSSSSRKSKMSAA